GQRPEEPPAQQRRGQRVEEGRLGGQHRDPAGLDRRHGGAAPDGQALDVADFGDLPHRRNRRDHRFGGGRQRGRGAGEGLAGGDGQQVGLGPELGEQVRLGGGGDPQDRDQGGDRDRDAQR